MTPRSSAFNLRKIAAVAWTSRISLNILKNRREAEDEEMKEDTDSPIPVGDMEGPVPMGDTEEIVTEDVVEDRIIKCMDAGVERNIAGNLRDPAEESNAYVRV